VSASQTVDPRDTILVVDDDRDLQRMLRTAFEVKGFRVETADDGLAAVDFLKTGRKTDLAVLDLFMPSMDGWAALAQMQRFPNRPPVVVLSGTSEVDITPRIFREGVEAFIAKPFQLDVLVNTCQELISRAKGHPPTPERRHQGTRRTLTLPVDILDADDRLLQRGRLLNLSVYGARVELPGALPPGQRLRMVHAPESDDTLSVEGRVQWWRRPDASCGLTCHGIAFAGVSADQRRRIQEIAALD
jgi:DNA-binding response OmpR family regulator